MLCSALGHGIGKFGERRSPHQVHVLDLDVTGRPVRMLEQEVDPRIASILHFAPYSRVAGELRYQAGCHRFGCERVGLRGVDADELGTGAEIDFDQLPAVGELALCIR